MRRILYPHQVSAIAALRLSPMAGKRRPLIQTPTGAGKTMLAASIVDGALKPAKETTNA